MYSNNSFDFEALDRPQPKMLEDLLYLPTITFDILVIKHEHDISSERLVNNSYYSTGREAGYLLILNHAYYLHGSVTFWTGKGVNLIHPVKCSFAAPFRDFTG